MELHVSLGFGKSEALENRGRGARRLFLEEIILRPGVAIL